MRAELFAVALALAACAGPGPAADAPAVRDEGPAAPPAATRAGAPPRARCHACQAALAGQAWRWPDGRLSCDGCQAEAVVSLDEARALLRAAHADLRRVLSVDAPDPDLRVALALVDRGRLDGRAGPALAHPSLLALTSADPDRPGEPARLDLLWGLPRGALRGILAHELFHAHQLARLHARGVRDLAEPAFVEGAALHVHHRVLVDLGAARWAALVASDEEPAAGGGLRRFRTLVRAVGEPRALELAATTTRFPPGF